MFVTDVGSDVGKSVATSSQRRDARHSVFMRFEIHMGNAQTIYAPTGVVVATAIVVLRKAVRTRAHNLVQGPGEGHNNVGEGICSSVVNAFI